MIPKLHENFISNAIKKIKGDSRIIALAAGGSYITGEMDEFSDLDLVIVTEDDCFEDIMDTRKELAESLGQLLTSFTGEHVGEKRLLICLYGPECLHVDLKFVSIKDFQNRIENPIVLWERYDCISQILKESEGKFPSPSMQWIEDRFWVWVHYGATKIGRGELFETIEFLSFLRTVVIGPLILMKHNELPKGVRQIEFIATKDAENLQETVVSYDKESCIKSLRLMIKMYKELRELLITDKLDKRVDVEYAAIEYLEKIE